MLALCAATTILRFQMSVCTGEGKASADGPDMPPERVFEGVGLNSTLRRV